MVGVTYHPPYDVPEWLKAYGSERGFSFTEFNLLLRATGPFDPLRATLDLVVGYRPTTVNQHAIQVAVFAEGASRQPLFSGTEWMQPNS